MPVGREIRMTKAYLIGSGIAGLSSAAFLIRDGGFAGSDILILEEQDRKGGSLDASGTAASGYSMRGGRMFEIQFLCTYDLLGSIPSIDDPDKSVTDDTFEFHDDFAWNDQSRLVDDDGRVVDTHSMGFTERDRLELVKCAVTPERLLDGKRISDCFSDQFFTTKFWYMWCTTFAFEPWHSAMEFRRYLNRFIHLFPTFDTMSGIYRTRYNQYDSIVRPLLSWLGEQGVTIQLNTRVTDLALADTAGCTVAAISVMRDGLPQEIEVGADDLVFVTNGSMTANSSIGSTDAAPVLDTSRAGGSWSLWETLAAKRDDFGDPSVFTDAIQDSMWESFTVTTKDPLFFDLMEKFSGSAAGKGGLITFTASNWLLTIALNHQPHFRHQPADTFVWWGYGLFPDKVGNYMQKKMSECSGREILQEVLHHLRFDERLDQIVESAIVVPCMMPYITSQFLVRKHGDRPAVVPKGSTNLAFVGQFAEVPDDVVFTVEYSVRTAWAAVATLLKLDQQPPPVYQGRYDPRVLVHALETMHRR
jgi:oleate hydratase